MRDHIVPKLPKWPFFIGDALMLTSRVKFDTPRVKPSSATQRYWSMWSRTPSSSDAIKAGVEALRNQLRVSP